MSNTNLSLRYKLLIVTLSQFYLPEGSDKMENQDDNIVHSLNIMVEIPCSLRLRFIRLKHTNKHTPFILMFSVLNRSQEKPNHVAELLQKETKPNFSVQFGMFFQMPLKTLNKKYVSF